MTVDQPVGTGFSYVNTDSYLHELPELIFLPYRCSQEIDGGAIFDIFGEMD